MLSAMGGNFLMNNTAYFIKNGETKKTYFKFMDLEFKNSTYNQVGGNISSQRIDRSIQTDWQLDFNVKDYLYIGKDKYMITDIPPFTKSNPLVKFDKLITLRLIKVAN